MKGIFVLLVRNCYLGTPLGTILDVFLNIFQTAFDPPPLVLNIYVADFSKVLLKSA